MTLTNVQLATIETYLLSWELQFRDFYDEMFDHFCTEIEQRMSGGTSFENALAETSKMFSGYEYGVGLSPKKYGLKAYEMEWEAKYRKRNNMLIFRELKGSLLSLKFFIWVVSYLLIYQLSIFFELPKLWAFLLIPSMVSLVLTYTYIYSWRGFKWRNVFVRKSFQRVHRSRETLNTTPKTFIHHVAFAINLFNIFLNVPRLFIDDYVIPLYVGITFSVAMLLLSYVFYAVVKRSIEEEKLNLIIPEFNAQAIDEKS